MIDKYNLPLMINSCDLKKLRDEIEDSDIEHIEAICILLDRIVTAEKALKILAKCLGQKVACEDCQFEGECRNEDVCAASQRYINWAVEKARELG